MRKRIIYLTACLIGSILLMAMMYSFSLYTSNNPNGFVRRLPSHKIIGLVGKDIKYNSWYFAGDQKDSVFLGNLSNPYKLLRVDSGLKDSSMISLKGFENVQLYKGVSTILDEGKYYLIDGMKPVIMTGSYFDLNLNRQIRVPYFTAAKPLTQGSFVLRYVNTKNENVLAKLIVGSDSLKSTHLLEKQVDGIFCTDGEMVKIPGSSKMIYVYYYRNQFLCVDSNLNLLYKGKTIDTVSHTQIKVAKIVSTGETTISAPPLTVNKKACANSKYLFVQSGLRANNETDYMIKDVSMIDVYAVKDGMYQFSFYLPDFRGNKVRDFKVYGQSLYALYDHYLYKYQLNF